MSVNYVVSKDTMRTHSTEKGLIPIIRSPNKKAAPPAYFHTSDFTIKSRVLYLPDCCEQFFSIFTRRPTEPLLGDAHNKNTLSCSRDISLMFSGFSNLVDLVRLKVQC